MESNLLQLVRHKFIRLILFLIYRSRETILNEFGSVISPLEVSIRNSKKLEKRFKTFLNLVAPKLQVQGEYLRLGSTNDGGYVVTKSILKKIDYLVSGGIEYNNDFEIAVANLGIRGIQIDNSIVQAPKSHPNLHFINATLGTSVNNVNDYFPKEAKSLLLKLDIEGSEYATLSQIKSFKRIDCLIIEFHNLHKLAYDDFWFEFNNLVTKLKKIYEIVFTNCNNAGGIFVMGNNLMPKVIEVTFIKRALSNPNKSKGMFSSDSVNSRRLPKITLHYTND